jgi:dihydroorotate dehydrogenase
MQHYDRHRGYEWNYAAAPEAPPVMEAPAAVPGAWDYCGIPVGSPLGIAAGPLLNGRWVLYYAALGFDVLTYKTVRTVARACYDPPNLQPVRVEGFGWPGDAPLVADEEMRGSWAVSFGMPSRPPDVWRADVEATRRALPKGKVLSVSVVATSRERWGLDELADDFATCARWAVDSGADCVEANFSCPNVATCDGHLYLNSADAGAVAARVRSAIGHTPLLVKIGRLIDEHVARRVIDALAPHADALVMVNCVPCAVIDRDGGRMFGGERRGIAGTAIREAVLAQVQFFSALIRLRQPALRLVGVGGIGGAQDIRNFLTSGCHAVQIATAAMLDPMVGLCIRRELPGATATVPEPFPVAP